MKTTPLKLAILVRLFPNIVQTYVLSHILSMKKLGVQTKIIAISDPRQNEVHPDVLTHKLLDETQYIDTAESLFKQLFNTKVISGQFLLNLVRIVFSKIWTRHELSYVLKSILRARMLTGNRFNMIHSHSLFSTYDFLFLKEVFGIPMTTTFHGLVPKDVKMLEPEKIKKVVESTDAFFVNTKFSCEQLKELGCAQEKIHIIPQGTNVHDFAFKARAIQESETIHILSVGRLSIEKGFKYSIEAVASLAASFPNIKYQIIGGGPEEESLRKLIAQHKMENHIEIYGSVSTPLLMEAYSRAHIFILPSVDFRDGSHTETQGVVLQEAQSSGIPVIASHTGGIPEVIIDGETGLLFEERNTQQLAQHIESLIVDKEKYQALSVTARKYVEDNLSNEVIYQRIYDVYLSVLVSN